jgi:Na+/melibiose symporter-like transporter
VTRVLYPAGFFGFLFLNTLFNQWVVVAHASAGPLLLVGYAAQGLLSPFWGHLGDRARARFGTRRVLTLAAVPVVLLAFWGALTAQAPAAVVLLYCLCFSVALQPYLALIPSLAATDSARAHAMTVGMAFALGAAAAALVAGPLVVQRFGLGGLALAGAAVFALTSGLPALLVRERADGGKAALAPGRLWAALREALGGAQARRFVAGATLLTATQMALVVSGPFVAGALLARPVAATAVLNGFLVAGLFGALGLMVRFGRRAHPLTLLRAGAVLASATLAVLGLVTLLPPSRLADLLCAACFLCLGSLALAVVALPPLVASRLSEAGREGVFLGLSGASNGFGNALGALVASSLVQGGTRAGLQLTIAFAAASAALAAIVLPRHAE